MYMSDPKQETESDVSCEADKMKKKDVLPAVCTSDRVTPVAGERRDNKPNELPIRGETWSRESHRDSGYAPSPSSISATPPGSLTPRDRHFRFDYLPDTTIPEHEDEDVFPHLRSTSCSSIREEDEDESIHDDDTGGDADSHIVFDLGPTVIDGDAPTHDSSPDLASLPVPIPPNTSHTFGSGLSPRDASFMTPLGSPGGSPGSYSGSFTRRRLRMHSTPVMGESQGGLAYFSSSLSPNPVGRSSTQNQRNDVTCNRSTQTPNPHCQVIESAIRIRRSSSSHQPLRRTYVTARGRAVERFRLHSEGDNDEDEDASFPMLLPELPNYRRDRSQSEPAVPAWQRTQTERRLGRELRRISDEFHDSYCDLRQGRNQEMPRPSSYPGARDDGHSGQEGRPFWHNIWRYFSGQQNNAQQTRRTRSQSTSSLSQSK